MKRGDGSVGMRKRRQGEDRARSEYKWFLILPSSAIGILCASFRQVLVQPVLQAGAWHGLPSSVHENNDRARMTSLPNETATATAIPFEMMEEAATLVSDEEEGGKKYRRVSIGGSARKRSFEREKEEQKNRLTANE